jgi:subtilisin family serine protease
MTYQQARRFVAIGAAVCLMLLDGVPSRASRQPERMLFLPDEVVVGYAAGTDEWTRRSVREAVGAAGYRAMPTLDVLELTPGTSVSEALSRVPRLRHVTYAEPNYILRMTAEPNDPMYEDAWSVGPSNTSGFRSGIDTPSVWNLTVGTPDVTVAVVDSGIDLGHPDLTPNLWTNPGETGGGRESNRIDDDKNGFVDDWRGWDWTGQDNDPIDLNGHGTMVAGTVGAQGDNGIGVSGVSWNTQMISLRVLNEQGLGLSSDTASAFAYAGDVGARIVNASLTSPLPSLAMLEAISSSPETLYVVAAGNDSANNDIQPKYPCNLELPNVLCVAATDEFNGLASFSNYGAVTVDLAAPGVRILTTHPDGYVEFHGSSAATPHVSGAAALLWSRHPQASVAQITQALIKGVEAVPQLRGKTLAGGRLNAAGALRQFGDDVPHDGGKLREGEGGEKVDTQKMKKKKKRCRHRKRGLTPPRRRRCRRR